jgi:hypothetical protein
MDNLFVFPVFDVLEAVYYTYLYCIRLNLFCFQNSIKEVSTEGNSGELNELFVRNAIIYLDNKYYFQDKKRGINT